MRNTSAETITVPVPIAFKRRRGRKRVVTPDGVELRPEREPEIDNALVKAIARAYRWQRMLESGEYATLRELAKAEQIDLSYVSRIIRLTLLSPQLVEAILHGIHGLSTTSEILKQSPPLCWLEQKKLFSLALRETEHRIE